MDKIKFVRNDTYNFLKSFNDNVVAKIFGLLELLDELGINLGPPKLKKVSKDVYELRIMGKPSIRILCSFFKGKIFILHAFIKKSQKMPKRELEKAVHKLMYLY